MNKKINSIFQSVLLLSSSLFFPLTAYAQEGGGLTVDNYDLEAINPLNIGNTTNTSLAEQLSTPGGIISRVLVFAFPLAGLILFVMIVWGGFETLAGSATKKSVESGRKRITSAILGFILLFASYWIIQIIQLVFEVQIL